MTATVMFSTQRLAQQDLLSVYTAVAQPGAISLTPNGPRDWLQVSAARTPVERAVDTALAHGLGFSPAIAEAVDVMLGWWSGSEHILRARPSIVKLEVTSETAQILPELMSFQTGEERPIWLDQIAPIYRTIGLVGRSHAVPVPTSRLAILFQDQEDFRWLATEIKDAFEQHEGCEANTFAGSELAASPDQRIDGLIEIFRRHRAVLFLGHLHRVEGGSAGWKLTDGNTDADWLPIEQLAELLGWDRGSGGSLPRRQRQAPCVPELVVTACCSGAWKHVDRHGNVVFYPERFLMAGVRFFVGAWMDVVLSNTRHDEDRDALRTMLSTFLERWARNRDDAVQHLYAAKLATNFHLVTSLFQLYGWSEEPQPGQAVPPNVFVDSLGPGACVGEYVLAEELWTDRYARAFWATTGEPEKPCLVQVLVDEWQENETLVGRLDAAVESLQRARLGSAHLVPTRHELARWTPAAEAPPRSLHILVYERPDGELPASWSRLEGLSPGPDSHRFRQARDIVGQISVALDELHTRRGQPHGNLQPDNVVQLDHHDGLGRRVVLKDAWVKAVGAPRCTDVRYAPPEELAQDEADEQPRHDCWALGVLLFERAAGHSPFDDESANRVVVPVLADRIDREATPDVYALAQTLDRVVRECLMPVPASRPTAEQVANWLNMARVTGDPSGQLAAQVHVLLRTGRRLIGIVSDDAEEVEMALTGLVGPVWSGPLRYSLYIAAEERNVEARPSGQSVHDWIHTETIQEIAQEEAARQGGQASVIDIDQVAAINADKILGWASNLIVPPHELAIVLLRGGEWWQAAGFGGPPSAWRRLHQIQDGWSNVAVIVVDSSFNLQEDLARRFVVFSAPPPSSAELLNQILAPPREKLPPLAAINPATAVDLATRIYPCTRRELTEAIRVCAIQYGVLDDRLVETRDDARARRLRQIGTATYEPASRLPDPGTIGLPQRLARMVAAWVEAIKAAQGGPVGPLLPRRVLVSGPSGSGKTLLARTLGRRLDLPIVRISMDRCLRGSRAESEQALAATLGVAGQLGGALVLLDDVDRLFQPGGAVAGAAPNGAEPVLGGLASVLLAWFDELPAGVVVVLTATNPGALPPQWRWRAGLHIPLATAHSFGGDPSAILAYRSSIFAAVFRRVGLADLADDAALMFELARNTHSTLGSPPLSPFARSRPDLVDEHRVPLETGAEIESWIAESIRFACGSGDGDAPATADFWREAVRVPGRGGSLL